MITLPKVADLQDPATIPIKNEEAREQSRLVAALRRHWHKLPKHNRPLVFAVPNGGKRNSAEAANLKAQGVLAGVADVFILLPRGITLLLEMKAGDGRQSTSQVEFEENAVALGFVYIVAHSAEDALKKLGGVAWKKVWEG